MIWFFFVFTKLWLDFWIISSSNSTFFDFFVKLAKKAVMARRQTKHEKIFREIISNLDVFLGTRWIHSIFVDFLNCTENFVKSSQLFYWRIFLLIDLMIYLVFFPWNWIGLSQHTVLAITTKSPENKDFWILEF